MVIQVMLKKNCGLAFGDSSIRLFNQGSYGKPQTGGGLKLMPLEILYLLEIRKLK